MKLTISDKQSENVQSVYLNGKRIVDPVGFDTDEGWVDYINPSVDHLDLQADSGITKKDEEFVQERPPKAVLDGLPPELQHQIARKQGKVRVVFYDGTVYPPEVSEV